MFGDAGLEFIEDLRRVPVVEALVVDHDVGGENGEARSDLGCMQIVYRAHMRLLEQVLTNRAEVESAGCRFEQHVDGFAQEKQTARQDEGTDNEGGDGIRPGPAGEGDHNGRHDYGERTERVIADLKKCGAQVEVSATAPPKHEECSDVAGEADDAEYEKRIRHDRSRGDEPVDSLDQDEKSNSEQNGGLRRGRENLGTTVSPGAPGGRRPPGQGRGSERNGKTAGIRQQVPGIDDECEAASEKGPNNFGKEDGHADAQGSHET
jgi:hypothetical protein